MRVDPSVAINAALPSLSRHPNASAESAMTPPSASKGDEVRPTADGAPSSTGLKASSNDGAESGDSPVVKQLKAQINALRQRLSALQRQIEAESKQASVDKEAAAKLQALSTEASAVSAALETAQGQLAQAQQAEGKSSGSLFSATA
ncbi:hypothetical protein FUT88_23420 [Ralstonia sp. TCR112]|uniref:hypothetical protein n=1 Tax=Ralstonia sp. TCR112 TaxID=2601730 RepID=UPI0011BEE683|nr:hypothetical protein [Ralstonia sp. TCR112]TXD55025.1 hypothetical protein FUT88_23420 [Ralstonia sp. TCR112]